jgi:hypothetical protein
MALILISYGDIEVHDGYKPLLIIYTVKFSIFTVDLSGFVVLLTVDLSGFVLYLQLI